MRFVHHGNFLGLPALTVPVGYEDHDDGEDGEDGVGVPGLPIGMQAMANHWQVRC